MLLLRDDQLHARRAVANEDLRALADSLAADLEPLMARDVYVPTAKALLSRAGGRCADDGAALGFDPFSPHAHTCPQCARVYEGELHHRWWIYPYQLWLAERAVHGAVLYALRGEERHAQLARAILARHAELYLAYPNRDNVLGPTRPFFSTYLESIWLLQICIALDALESAGDRSLSDVVRERIVAPSAALIAQYNEGLSNRQVWNNAALMAAALLTNDRRGAERIVRDRSGVETHLTHGLLADGTWYEGDNYHAFAHRGLWYATTFAATAGIGIDPALLARFDEGFATPFATALPDFTFPSRKDSQYAVSLAQWRFAEFCELGFARTGDRRLAAALARMYDGSAPERDTERSRSTADVERNVPASRLTRADLNWRGLLHAAPRLPPLESAPPRSVHLEAQGLTVFRREGGDVYVALDWGQSGGGHGHPDRLNVLFAHGSTRWLDDLGTGSYVDPSLHWYRSTLAHNAPLAGGHSQQRVDGTLLAHDERGGFGWVLAEASGIAPGVRAQRALIVTPDYFIDELRWTADTPTRFELPVHFDDDAPGVTFEEAILDGGDGEEDGFAFITDVLAARPTSQVPSLTSQIPRPTPLVGSSNDSTARAWIETGGTLFRARAPGQPASAMRSFYVIRCEGTSGVIRSVWAWSPRVTAAAFDGDRIRITLGDEHHEHWQTPKYWQAELRVGDAHSGIELFGWRQPAVATTDVPYVPAAEPLRVTRGAAHTFELGEAHYRRSEDTWQDAGSPSASVTITATERKLSIDVVAHTAPVVFVNDDAENPYDNEQPDINGHGVQLYVATPWGAAAWLAAPVRDTTVPRVRSLADTAALRLEHAAWRPTDDGFAMRFQVALPRAARDEYPIALDVLVNETTAERARRRGQLVLSGGAGEFVYLRGDRHDPSALVPLVIVDA